LVSPLHTLVFNTDIKTAAVLKTAECYKERFAFEKRVKSQPDPATPVAFCSIHEFIQVNAGTVLLNWPHSLIRPTS